MTDPGDELMRRIEAIDTAAAGNARAAEAYQRMTEELAAVTGTATSPDGVVTVVAGADGAVTGVTFTDGVRHVAPRTLSESVTHTIARARYAAARAQAEVVRRGLGDTELLDRVLDEDARVFGDRRAEEPGPPPVPPAQPEPGSSPAPSPDRHATSPPAPAWGTPGPRHARRRREPEPEDYSQFSYMRRGR